MVQEVMSHALHTVILGQRKQRGRSIKRSSAEVEELRRSGVNIDPDTISILLQKSCGRENRIHVLNITEKKASSFFDVPGEAANDKESMATVAAMQSALTCEFAVGLSTSSLSVLGAVNNLASRTLDSAAGLRLLSSRATPRSEGRRQRTGCYKGPSALFDRGTGGNETKKEEKKFITKEQEPEQYWQTPAEREGKNPMTTPLPYIAILSVLTPFIVLGIAFANNWIKVPVR